jgi:hypothetical protein
MFYSGLGKEKIEYWKEWERTEEDGEGRIGEEERTEDR